MRFSVRLGRAAASLLAILIVGCSPDRTSPPAAKVVNVCEAIDSGHDQLGRRITVVGWLDISRHESRIGDANCPSQRRFTYLAARFKTPVVVTVADPNDQQSAQVAADLRRYPIGVEWGMRGRFIGRLLVRPSPEVETAFDPPTEVVPFIFEIEEIQGMKVERPPYYPPPLDNSQLP